MRQPASSVMYMPKMTGGRVFRKSMVGSTRMTGMGTGSFLLDGGMGGQSSYESIDDYVSTISNPRMQSRQIGGMKGSGVASSLAKVGGKISDLMIKTETKKPPRKNINFSL